MAARSYILTLNYQRMRQKLSSGEYPFSGSIVLEPTDVSGSVTESFVGWTYQRIISRLHDLLNQLSVTRVMFQRTERDDIYPVELGERMVELIKKDPVAAHQAMTWEPQQRPQRTDGPVPAGYDTIAESFGDSVYLRMSNGRIEDPETGRMLTIAYGEQYGWRVRREDNRPSSWIQFELVDESPDGTSFGERIAFAQWARVGVEDLLKQGFERYYLPRSWNIEGPWISHDNLKARLERYMAEREKATC